MFIPFPLPAQVGERYIEVTGTSEIEVVPDRIHYVIEIREYFEEEFDGVSKPEEYRTKVPLTRIEEELRKVLKIVGVHGRQSAQRMWAIIGVSRDRIFWFPNHLMSRYVTSH